MATQPPAWSRYCPRCGAGTDAAMCPTDGSPTFQHALKGSETKALAVGDVIGGRYKIQGILGQGGFGAVFAAEHLMTGQRVAVKVMLGDFASSGPDLVQRFLQEARVTASLSHPNTVRIYDFGQTDDGVLFMAMEHLRGPTLESMLQEADKAGKALTQQETVSIGVQVLRSLTEAHAAGLVHRDLKPGNLIAVQIVGEPSIIKVLDFGIARAHDSQLTQTGMAMGTPTFMSPEQARGEKADGRSDLYSLGCILYCCVAGQPPFVGDSAMSILLAHQLNPLPDLRITAKVPVSESFVACIERATAKKVGDRFESAIAMREALEAALAPSPSAVAPAPSGEVWAPTLEADVITDSPAGEVDDEHELARRRARQAEISAPTMAAVAVDDETETRERDVVGQEMMVTSELARRPPKRAATASPAPAPSAPPGKARAPVATRPPAPRAPRAAPRAAPSAQPDDLTPMPAPLPTPANAPTVMADVIAIARDDRPATTASGASEPPAQSRALLVGGLVFVAIVVLGLAGWLLTRPAATPVAAAPASVAPAEVAPVEAEAAPTPAPTAAPAPTPAPEPTPAPTPAPEPTPEPTPAPEPSPEPTPAPEPTPEPEPESKPTARRTPPKPPAKPRPQPPKPPRSDKPKPKNSGAYELL